MKDTPEEDQYILHVHYQWCNSNINRLILVFKVGSSQHRKYLITTTHIYNTFQISEFLHTPLEFFNETSNIIYMNTGLASTHAFHQYLDVPAHTSPDIPWKLLSMSLDPVEGKSSISGEGLCSFARERDWCPHFERSKQTPQQPTCTGIMLNVGSLTLYCISWIQYTSKGSDEAFENGTKIIINLFSTWNGKKRLSKISLNRWSGTSMSRNEHFKHIEIGPPLN